MSGRRDLIQADFDRATRAIVKAGLSPEIVFDLANSTVTVRPAANANNLPKNDWQERAPDRV